MIKNKLKLFWQSRLVKSVIVVASGTAGAQAIGMVFIPFITRAFGPEAYGILGTLIALTGVLTTIGALAYPVAIVLPESDNVAKALVKLSLLIATSISLLILGILWIAGDQIMSQLGADSLIEFMFFIPLIIFLTTCQDAAQQWLIRKKAFKGIAQVSITHSTINYGSQALAGLYAPIPVALISIHTLAIAIRFVLTGYIGKRIIDTLENHKKEKISLLKVAYQYRDFPLYRAPQVLLNAASQSLPILVLTAFFGSATAGFYALTLTALGLPSILLGSAVQSVFYPNINEVVLQKKRTLPLVLKATAVLAIIGIWPFLIVILFGPFLFSIIFGEKWEIAGEYARWMSIWFFLVLISRPIISSIPVFKMQRWFLMYEFFSSSLRVVSIYCGFIYFSSALVAVAIYSIVSSLIYIYIIIKFILLAKVFDQDNIGKK